MTSAQLIQRQSNGPDLSVTVWRERVSDEPSGAWVFRKVWACGASPDAQAWLSWAENEHLILTLLGHEHSPHVVEVCSLQRHPDRVEVVTRDAGPELRRHWLGHLTTPMLFERESDVLRLARACLKGLLEVHTWRVIHGDVKADNLCIPAAPSSGQGRIRLDLRHLRWIDFAYAVHSERPLKFVLPTDPVRLDYLPDFYREAIVKSQQSRDPSWIQRAACPAVDLFGLLQMLTSMSAPGRTSGWHAWSRWQRACRGWCQPPRSEEDIWERPTFELLAYTEELLQALDEPASSWDKMGTHLPESMQEVFSTPLLPDHQTPALTPLLPGTMAGGVLPAVSEMPSYLSDKPSIQSSQKGSVKPWRQWLASAALMGLFVWIDQQFQHSGQRLSDAEVISGLLAMVIAPLFGVTSFWQWWTRSNKLRLATSIMATVLCAIAAYLTMALFPQVVSAVVVATIIVALAILTWLWWS